MDDASATPHEHRTDEDPQVPAAPRVRPVDLRDYADFRRGPATRVRVFRTDHLAVDLWCLEPGSSTGVLHDPERDLVYTVIGGRPWFVTDDGELGLDPMGAMLVPADTVHGIDNRMPDPVIVLALTAPADAGEVEPPSGDEDATAAAVRWSEEQPGPIRRAVERLLGTSGQR
jgi:quercetin dioxygenase-like cupin family protein